MKISQTCLLRYSNILLYTGALLLRRDTMTEQTIQSKMRISHCAIFWIVLNAGTPILNQNFAFNSAKSEPAHMFEFKDGRNSMNTLSTCGVFNANMLLQWYRILISKCIKNEVLIFFVSVMAFGPLCRVGFLFTNTHYVRIHVNSWHVQKLLSKMKF